MLKKLCNRKGFPAGVLSILISGQPVYAFDITNIQQQNLSSSNDFGGTGRFNSSLNTLSSVITNGNEKSFSTKLKWFSAYKNTTPRIGQLYQLRHQYEFDFTVEDPENFGYTIVIDYALRGVASVRRDLDHSVLASTLTISGRLDDDDGNGFQIHSGFRLGSKGVIVNGTELPTMKQLTIKQIKSFSAPSDTSVGAPASYVGTKNFRINFNGTSRHSIGNRGTGESILNYGGDNSDPFFTLATNTNGELQSDLGLTTAIKVTSLAPPVGCSTIVVNTLDTYPGIIDPGSLRAAIECANDNPGPDIITFDSATIPVNSVITLAPPTSDPYEQDNYLSITDEVTITGLTSGDPSSIIIEGNNNRIFKSSATVTLENMTLRKGNTSARPGGAIHIAQYDASAIPSTLTLNHTLLTDNHAKSANGGAIYARNTNVNINNSTLSLNSADGNGTSFSGGGAIHSDYSVNLTNSTVSNNSTTGTANSKGGGIFSFKTVTLDSSTVEGNSTGGNDSSGGGIQSEDTVVLTNGSIVSNNKTMGSNSPGGGIFAAKKITVTSSSVTDNSTNNTYSPGGGIYTRTDFVDISSSTISGNSTSGFESPGGGVYVQLSKKSIIKQSTISNNSTASDSSSGGGISSPQGSFDIYNSTISANMTKGASSNGGGISATSMKLSQSTVSGNHVDNGSSSGGGAHIEGAFYQNEGYGGVFEAPTEIIQSTITENFHGSDGISGISIRALNYDTTITNSIISGNGQDGDSNLSFVSPPGSSPSVINLNYNLLGNFESAFTSVLGTNIGNLFETVAGLLPLSDNGGVTFTHLPKLTSKAIDKGNEIDAPAITDQRGTGFIRKIGSTVDIGSVERYIIPGAVCVPTSTTGSSDID